MTKEQKGALSGYRILDLSDSKGAYCTKLLADLGADVIKVEGPGGDPGRNMPPFAGGDHHIEKSLYFLYRNANKRGVTLDLESDEGKGALKELVKSADVLVENSGPGVMQGLGLGYEALKGINPHLVMAGITEFGLDGPFKDYKGSNIVDFALSGVMITSGYPGKAPCLLPGTPAHDATSLIAAIQILAALYCRDALGKGQRIDVSVHEAARTSLYPWSVPIYSHSLTPDGPLPAPETRLGSQIYPVYPCKDGYIRVIALTPRQWQALLKVLGNPDVLMAPEWESFIYRIGNSEDLYALMLGFTTQFTQIELWEAGFREGVPIAPIYDIPSFVNSADAKARNFFVNLDHPVVGKGAYPGPPYNWTVTQPSVSRPAPTLGQHNDEILSQRAEPASSKTAIERASKPHGPLEGVTAVSLGTGVVVPDAGKILGELGANVIKIESSENLDFMRTIAAEKNSSAGFNETNRNKRSFGANLKSERGREIVKQIIAKADVVAENFRGGVVESLGLDYESVRPLNPEVVYISSQGFGGGGPHSDYPAYGPMLSSGSGMLSMWKDPSDPYPVGSNSPLPDHMASKQVVVAILAALDYKRRSGKGQFIDMAQTEVAAGLIGEHYLDYTINQREPQPIGNRCLYAAPHGCYPCTGTDNWVAISVFTDDEWQAFVKAIGSPDWATDPKLATVEGRLANVDELDSRMSEWTASREAWEVMETLQEARVAAGVVQRAPDTIKDPQIAFDNALIEIDHPVVGKRLYPNIPFRMSETPPPPTTPPPLLGQHTAEICRELLGMTEDEIQKLKQEGILESPDI